VPNPDDRSITKSEELRFTLFRHWNLYDAMLHSGYVAGRMSIWKEKGRKRLQGLLAKMGFVAFLSLLSEDLLGDRFSLQQCQQAYAHMDMDLKRHLRAKLDAIGPEYGLVELEYPSFTRAYGFRLATLSAADAVEGISALLEAATGVRIEVEVDGGRGGGEWFGGSRQWDITGLGGTIGENDKLKPGRDEDEVETENGRAVRREQVWNVTNFWVAYDALGDE
jgi:cell division control protein 45